MSEANYYEVLHVQSDAPLEIIKASYRALMMQLNAHPDRGGNTEQAALINIAYNTLKNPASRAKYDASLNTTTHTTNEPEQDATQAPESKVICLFCQHINHASEHYLEAVCNNCNSPLFSMSLDDSKEQRSLLRIDKSEICNYYIHWPGQPYAAKLVDISPQGLSLQTPKLLALSQTIKLQSNSLQGIATVKNVRQIGSAAEPLYIVGVQFNTVQFHMDRGNFISTSA